ncbi:trypsin delta-like [Anopheles cruzii]|uniref:trypsin delta-like n=1 Tax=Anopheles cruzii TaxID=68878 RepID=UPI0022EC54F2|nr:trypsin delta-like [Anopheles cruzii]
MKQVIGSIVFALFCSVVHTVQPNGTSNVESPRIIGGLDLDFSYAPYVLFMTLYNNPHCGASVISHYFAVTAAHCVHQKPVNAIALHGGSSVRGSGGHWFYLEYYKMHGSYNNFSLANDAAVLKVTESFLAYPVGWGQIQPPPSRAIPVNLQIGHYKLVSQATCASQWAPLGVRIYDVMVCGQPTYGRTCFGDSGGPFVCDGHLYGIVSFVDTPCRYSVPQGFAKVDHSKR